MAAQFKIPELPPNKSYHLFVCYQNKSLDIVRRIVESLEANGVTCCYYDRDFLPGQTIVRNMHDAIRDSVNMLIVLSEDFEQSDFCRHEVEEAFNLKIKEEYSLIPIKTEPCSVPENLQHLVYIDVEDDIERAHDKIIDAILKKDTREDMRRDHRNGECLQFKLKPYKPSKLSFKRFKLTFTDSDKAQIWRKKFEVSPDILHDIENTVNGSLLVKYWHVWRHPHWIIFNIHLYLLLLLMITFLLLFITTSGREMAAKFQPAGYALAVGLPVWLLSLIVSETVYAHFEIDEKAIFGVYNQASRALNEELWKISNENNRQTGMIFFLPGLEKTALDFTLMRYNFKRCKVCFARRLEEKETLKKNRQKNESKEECTTRLFGHFMSLNGHLLFRSSAKGRHNMENGAKCVCLLVEEWLEHKL